jgi:hypothetical protein
LGWHIYSTDIPQYSGGLTRLELPQQPYHQSVKAAVQHFLESIVNQTEPLTSGRDNLRLWL